MDKRLLGDPGTENFRVSSYPFYLINRLSSRYNAVIDARLREIGLDIPGWRVLMVLGEHDPRGVRQLADTAVIPLSTMTRIVQRMSTSGLVTSIAHPNDARVTEVHLTAAGRDKLAEARAVASPVYRQVIRGLSEADFQRLTALLDLLYHNLSET